MDAVLRVLGFLCPTHESPPQQPINSHTDRAGSGGLSWPERRSPYSVLQSGAEPYVPPSRNWASTSQFPGLGRESPQSYYTTNSSPLLYLRTNSASTRSSNLSFPYSVTSISSYKSRKNVLYPRRVHPLPVAVSSDPSASVSPDALIWQVRFLCTTLLPHAETRLVPAARVLLQSLGLHGDFSQRVPVRTDEETRCCSELFIALTHEVLLKDAVNARELEGPCKLLHTTFKDILFKLGAFSLPKASKLNEQDLKASSAGALALERFSSVLRALSSVMDAFEVLL
ncbi:hypothetical protein BJY52DRAFT_1257576 [Lactarius psammicola]|nr:hypothetical protein BJY52DRAFT_1257576 [Lactarius psammicola]